MILTTRHPWQVQFAETPPPLVLSDYAAAAPTELHTRLSSIRDLMRSAAGMSAEA